MQRQARQRFAALLLRNNIRYSKKTTWTEAHRRWVAELKLPHRAQHLAFEEYVSAIQEADKRIERLEENLGALDIALSADEVMALEAAFPVGVTAGDRYPAEHLARVGI